MGIWSYRRNGGPEKFIYPGSKAGPGVFQSIINLMPPHECYIEPFYGGGAVMRLKRPARLNIGIDLDLEPLEKSMPRGAPPFRARRGGSAGPVKFSEAGLRYEFHNTDCLEFLRSYPFSGSELVYADPPYVRSSRATARAKYKHEMTDAQHRELLKVLNKLNCRVMISGYSTTLYAKGLKGWNATAFQAATRGKPAAEWIWYNFERPVELHDYRYLGNDFREREQIKRMQKRWVGKLEKMPMLRRQALLAAIATTASSGDVRSARA